MASRITRRLVVLQHGSHGTPADLTLLTSWLHKIHPADVPLTVCVPSDIQARGTNAGIARCSTALAKPVVAAIEAFARDVEQDGPEARGGVVLVGHSFGGVLLRGVVRELYALGLMGPRPLSRHNETSARLRVKYERFVTVACPHLGIGHTSNVLRFLASARQKRLKSQTYADLLLDRSRALDHLTSDDAAGAGLAEFSQRIIVAAAGDHLVSPCSSLIAPVDREQLSRLAMMVTSETERNFAISPETKVPIQTDRAVTAIDVAQLMPKTTAAITDLYSPYTDLSRWRIAAPRLDDGQLARVAFMAAHLRQSGPWDSYVATFPWWAKFAAHRMVIGKPPYHEPPRRSDTHVEAIARLALMGKLT
jgi:thioesterase domain-containing protein